MKQRDLKYSCLIAVLYFGMNVNAQVTPKKDSVTKEQKIEEVIVVGYGTQKKENVTGSIGVISSKDLADKPNPNALSSVQGKAAGVQIFNSGTPGGSPRVDIRGIGSMTGSTVYIVDGSITTDISYLNSQDIESMSILKDPASLAIYGAQAGNGAVIIKTKTGRGKKPTFNVNSYLGIKTVTNIPKMVNGDQYIELYNEKLSNDSTTPPLPTDFITKAQYPGNTDWYKEILRPSTINSNDFSASGAIGKLSYYGSVGYLQDEGNLDANKGINSGSNFKRFTTKANLSYKITDNITIGDNFTFSKILTNIASNPLLNAYIAPPVYGPINPSTGNYQYFTLANITNPRAQLDLFRSQNRQQRMLNNVWGEVKFLQDFTFRISLTNDNLNSSLYEYTPVMTYVPKPGNSTLITRDSRNRDYVWDNTLNWKKKFGSHNLDVLAGFSRTQNYYSQAYWNASNVNYDGTNGSLQISNGSDIFGIDVYNPGYNVVPYLSRIQSFFGRVNYDYAGKYLINASIRRDGSSNFNVNRNEVFPSVSAGWVVSKENFMSNQNIFDLLKLRGSWGRTGNPNVQYGAYQLSATAIKEGAYYGSTGAPAQTISQFIDTTIGWEITTGKDFGVEMAFLKNKLKFEATYFDKDTKDVVYGIVQGTVSGASNYNNYITNAFSFKNKGLELSVNYDAKISEKVKLGIYGNFTSLKNEITSVFGGSYQNAGASLFGNQIVRLEAGQAVGSYYGYQVAGVFQTDAEAAASAQGASGAKAGWFKFADQDGNGIIDERDKTFLGSPVPKGTYGFGFNMNISNIDFGIDFQGVFGNKIYNYNREQRYGNESWDLDFYNNRWHGAGTSNSYSMTTNNQSIILPSSFYVEDGSYFRIRNIQVGYTFPKGFSKWPNFNKVRIYLSAQNPWTTFKYHGFSPEITSTDRVSMGVDNNIYPMSAIYTMGTSITF